MRIKRFKRIELTEKIVSMKQTALSLNPIKKSTLKLKPYELSIS